VPPKLYKLATPHKPSSRQNTKRLKIYWIWVLSILIGNNILGLWGPGVISPILVLTGTIPRNMDHAKGILIGTAISITILSIPLILLIKSLKKKKNHLEENP
jgi:hypothetical protein